MLKDGKKQEHFLWKWEVVLSFDNDNIIKKAFEKVAQDVLLKTLSQHWCGEDPLLSMRNQNNHRVA